MFTLNSSKIVLMSVFFAALLSILINQTAAANDYPSPPPVPSKFENPEEVQKYLKLLHNYYLIVGRPRLVSIIKVLTFIIYKSFNLKYLF